MDILRAVLAWYKETSVWSFASSRVLALKENQGEARQCRNRLNSTIEIDQPQIFFNRGTILASILLDTNRDEES